MIAFIFFHSHNARLLWQIWNKISIRSTSNKHLMLDLGVVYFILGKLHVECSKQKSLSCTYSSPVFSLCEKEHLISKHPMPEQVQLTMPYTLAPSIILSGCNLSPVVKMLVTRSAYLDVAFLCKFLIFHPPECR